MHWDTLKWVFEAEHPEKVNKSTFVVLVALAYSMNPKNGRCNPSIERLCQLTRMGKTSVKSAISTLKKTGIISLCSGKRMERSNNYVIHYSAVPKKSRTTRVSTSQTPALRPDSEPSDLENGSNSGLNMGQNPTTNLLQINTHGTSPSFSCS